MAVTAPPTRARAGSRTWLVPFGLALFALVIRLPMFFSPRHVLFDDGVYGATVLAMRHGARPFHEVFSPQGPLHLPILYAGDLLGFRTLNAPRVAPVLAGIAVTLAVWAAGRRLGGHASAAPRRAWLPRPAPRGDHGPDHRRRHRACDRRVARHVSDRPTIVRAIGTGPRWAPRPPSVLVIPVASRAGGCGARRLTSWSHRLRSPRLAVTLPWASGRSTTNR
jgi:hypothetical protein